jgi:hypothetical protein
VDLAVGGLGEVEAYLAADDASSLARSASGPSAGPLPVVQADGFIRAELRAYLRREATGEWVEITSGLRDLTLSLRDDERRAGVRFFDEGVYSRFRIDFELVEANVLSRDVPSIPLGITRVSLGTSGVLSIERDVFVNVSTSSGVDLVVELGASTWLPTASGGVVSSNAFRNALTVRVR